MKIAVIFEIITFLILRSPRGATEYENPSSLEIRKRKYEKNVQNPPFGLGPENTEKIQKNYDEKGHFLTVFVIFVFLYFIYSFSFFFFSFRISRLEGLSHSVAPRGDLKSNSKTLQDGNGNSRKLSQMTFKMLIGNQWK